MVDIYCRWLFSIIDRMITISFQAVKAALANPVKNLRTE
jgi:hypothetical protein